MSTPQNVDPTDPSESIGASPEPTQDSSSDPAAEPCPAGVRAGVIKATSPRLVALQDPATKMFALTRLIAALDDQNQEEIVEQLRRAGMTEDMLSRLRTMQMTEVWRFVLGDAGLAVAIDPVMLGAYISEVDRAKQDNEMLRYFIHNGASPRLLTQLFPLGEGMARRLRRVLAPKLPVVGRPSFVRAELAEQISDVWVEIQREVECPRLRIRRLHERFSSVPIADLELVVLPQPAWVGIVVQAFGDPRIPRGSGAHSASPAAAYPPSSAPALSINPAAANPPAHGADLRPAAP